MTAPAVLHPARDRVRDPGRVRRGAALRRARLAAGLTQDDAGAAIGRAGAIVSRYESGDVDPPTSITVQLAELYRADVGAILTGGTR